MASVVRTWTAERVEQLQELAAACLSARQIGEQLGITRNAVLGRLFRMDMHLKRPDTPKKPRPKRTKRWTPKPKPDLEAIEATDLPPDQSFFETALMDLRDNQCRWPLAAGLYCGAPKMPPNERNWQSSFCRRHHQLAYRPARPNGGVTNAM